jgi:cytoskeletal protein CcmA (bactofilin family)
MIDEMKRTLEDESGFTLFSVFLILILMLTLGGASLVYSTLDLRSTTHYDTGNQAFYAAEAGIVHALSSINAVGVQKFKGDVVDRWSTVFGTSVKNVPEHNDVSYQVVAAASATNPTNKGTLTAIGFAPMEARRVLRVTLDKSGFDGSPGAIYLAADTVDSQFKGDAFLVDGNDHTTAGALTGGNQLPGISTRNGDVTNEVVGSLSDQQKDNVKGLGFSLSPLSPSVITTGGPGVDDLEVMIANILGTAGVVTDNSSNINGNQTFGSVAAPKITHLTNANVQLNGTAQGAGVLIVDGSLTINGTLDFTGWIIVRGDTVINHVADENNITTVLGHATVLGTLWTGHLEIKVGGSAVIDYCSTCLQLVDGIAPPDNLIPRPMKVISWQEIL